MALGMMGKGPKLRLSDEQRQQIRDVRAEQGRGAARQMRRQMRQEAGLPVRQMQNRPAPMPMQGQPVQAMQDQLSNMQAQPMPMPMPGRGQMPLDPGFQVTPEQMEALRQQPPMQKNITPEMLQDAMDRGRYQGAQQQPGRFPITDMMYRGPVNMTPEMQQALQNRYANVNPVPVQNTNTILPQQPMGVAQGIGQLAQQPNPFMPYRPYGM